MVRREKLKRQERGIVQAAIQFFETEVCQMDIKELEGSISTSYPAEYMLLMERVDALRKFVHKNPSYHKDRHGDYKIQGEVGIFDKLNAKRMADEAKKVRYGLCINCMEHPRKKGYNHCTGCLADIEDALKGGK